MYSIPLHAALLVQLISYNTMNVNEDIITLGHREIDRNFDWYSSLSLYPDIKTNLKSFDQYGVLPEGCIALTNEQQQVVDYVVNVVNTKNFQRCVLLLGAAGTGKTCVVLHLCHLIGEHRVLLIAPTGVSANIINGKTIHSALKITVSTSPLSEEALKELQEELKCIEIIIIDEFSMVGLNLLGKIDQRLRQAKPSRRNVLFGGILLIFCGDYHQLLPVCDIPLYGEPSNEMANRGKAAYAAFTKVFILTEVIRQQGPEQKPFVETLGRIRLGQITMADYDLLSSRFMSENINLVQEFKDAIRLVPSNIAAEKFNNAALAQIGKPITLCNAEHNNKKALYTQPDQASCLQPQLPLCVGARVLLRQKLYPSLGRYGLGHGSIGTVVDIVYDTPPVVYKDKVPPELPLCILVNFDNYHGPTIYNNVVPIKPFTASFSKSCVNCTRKQFPLELAHAITIHRAQGLTLTKAVIDIGTSEYALGITYAATSRVTAIEGLLYDPKFSSKRLLKINDHNGFIAKRVEIRRLENLPP